MVVFLSCVCFGIVVVQVEISEVNAKTDLNKPYLIFVFLVVNSSPSPNKCSAKDLCQPCLNSASLFGMGKCLR